ncbi:MAG: hypothetical protein ACYTEQ_23905, partial [Planctomycetota bacterium]
PQKTLPPRRVDRLSPTQFQRWQSAIAYKLSELFKDCGAEHCHRGKDPDGPDIESPLVWIVCQQEWGFEGKDVRLPELPEDAYERGLAKIKARVSANEIAARPVVVLKRGKRDIPTLVTMDFDTWMLFMGALYAQILEDL